MNKFVGLIILDGFGLRDETYGNAVKLANPVNFNKYFNLYPSTELEASGRAVGLPDGQMGNSEVGHLHIGSGRVVFQSLQRINNSISTGEFFHNPAFCKAMEHAKENNGTLHLMGLLSDAGVHSNINHLFALLKMAQNNGVKNVAIHAFLDGRDTAVDSGVKYLQSLLAELSKYNDYKLASITGRFYAMDREQNYNYTQIAYNAIVNGIGKYSNDPLSAVKESYRLGETDEFIKPIIVTENGKPVACINDGDAIIHFNFREDRGRQLTASLVENFDRFEVRKFKNVCMCTFTSYDEKFIKPLVAFKKDDLRVNLSSVISKNGLNQLKIAETTKYAHVTYFLNGGNETPYKNEKRVLIETIKNTPFEKVPQMRAKEITDCAVAEILSKKYTFMALNYSNPDMVGHTGDLSATISAIKEVDIQLKRLVDAILRIGGVAVVIADHGNAEMMLDSNGNKVTSHTTNKVPFVLISEPKLNVQLKQDGSLVNIAPTILQLLNISQPSEFTASSMIIN